MSLHFVPVAVKEVRKETDDCVSIAFDIKEEQQPDFQYQAGQYISIKTMINGEEVRRSYSLCSSPLDHEWRVAVKQVEGGLFSTYANQSLKKGDVLELMPPMGKFHAEASNIQPKNYVTFAAGSGITPIISIIKTILRSEPKSNVTLIYGNRSRSSVIFKEELEALKNKYMNRFQLTHILSREKTDAPINFGRIDGNKCEALFGKLVDETADEFFICGPEEMIFAVKNFLESKGIDKKKIHVELFTSAKKIASGKKEVVTNDHSPKSKITVKLDGRSFDFDLAFDSATILDAALKQGADLPFACKGGMCCTCKAKLMEGEVEMDVCWGLDQEEVEQGFILTCQSHPITEKVVVDFDVK